MDTLAKMSYKVNKYKIKPVRVDHKIRPGINFTATEIDSFGYGWGKPTPPTVPPVIHDGTLEGPERVACHHHSVCQGGREEEMADDRRGYSGESREVLSVLQQASRDGHIVQIPGVGLDSDR